MATLVLSAAVRGGQIRLIDASDRASFRSWLTLLVDRQFDQPAAEVTDCAALVRFAYRERFVRTRPSGAFLLGLVEPQL